MKRFLMTDVRPRSRRLKRIACITIAMVVALSLLMIPQTQEAQAAGQVNKRLKQVMKDYPDGSHINKMITVPAIVNERGFPGLRTIINGGCNALVAYTTLKIFHNPYVPGAKSYKKVGKTARTGSTASMKRLFKKAKKGDVIRWHSGRTHYHFAIFLSRNGSGVKVYEGNYGGKNQVRNHHQWNWDSMKYRTHGAKNVSVYRSKNYGKVNKGKAAKNLGKGKTFTFKGITYKVTKSGLRKGQVKVISKDRTVGKKPKAIGINYDTSKRLIRYGKREWDYYAMSYGKHYRIRAYSKNKGRWNNEQYFTVK